MRDFVQDTNGNIATVSYWGSIEAAKQALTTLTNCYNCYNCNKCIKCYNCNNCIKCYNCNNCNNCIKCTEQPLLNAATNLWIITIRQDKTMRIGCQDHSLEIWMNFSDEEINDMDDKALEFWKFWKPIVSHFA